MKEFEIQEDFLQMSELVHTETAYISRPPPIDSTNRSLSNTKFKIPKLTDEEVLLYERFLTEYFGSPAVLSEKISASREHVSSIYIVSNLKDVEKKSVRGLDFWILGASYNDTLRIDANDDVKCGAHSCYERSLRSGKICKPGSHSSLILFQITIRNNVFNALK